MAKTYFDIQTFVSGAVLTAAQMNTIGTTVDNIVVPPTASVYRNSALNHTASGSFQSIAFDTEDWDTDSMWTSGANADRITFGTDGLYLLEASVVFHGSGTTGRSARLVDSGTSTYIAYATQPVTTAGDGGALTLTRVWEFTAGDYVKLEAYQNTGGNLAYSVGQPGYVHLTATWVGRKTAP